MIRADFERLFDLWRAGDETAASEYFTDDGSYREAAKEPVRGRAAIARHWAPFFHGGPEWRMIVHDLFGVGDTFAVSYTWEIKTDSGAWTGAPGCALVRTRDGKIAEWHEYKG